MAHSLPQVPRSALSLRGVAREFGLGRAFLSQLVRDGQLPAVRRGRSLLVLRSDVERWFRIEGYRQARGVEGVVEARLEREERRARSG
jgi:excisionase family DNA binding protein